ncbi:ComEA family DNA-binding protein [Peptoniphilus sp. GNH]|nr:ComEA family DNA-binding protein [Peptoniphilus sp. GNH]
MDMRFVKKYLPTIVLGLALIFFAGKYFEYRVETRENEDFVENVEIENDKDIEDSKENIVVHVAGLVKNPGLYELKNGSRVEDAILAAGGPIGDGDINKLNRARILKDEEKITVEGPGSSEDEGSIQSSDSDKININKASLDELTKIPGIGPKTAEKIIKYREKSPFVHIEDLKSVQGIGDKKFESFKDFITCD